MKLDQVLRLIRKNYQTLQQMGVESLAVFGSTARDEATPGSDVDLLVTFSGPPTYDQYIETKFFLEDLLGCKVDLVPKIGLKQLIRESVEQEAVYVA